MKASRTAISIPTSSASAKSPKSVESLCKFDIENLIFIMIHSIYAMLCYAIFLKRLKRRLKAPCSAAHSIVARFPALLTSQPT